MSNYDRRKRKRRLARTTKSRTDRRKRSIQAMAADSDAEPHSQYTLTAAMNITAAVDGADGKPKLPTFTMVAYTGGPMKLFGWRHPVVVEYGGLTIPAQRMAIREDHITRIGNTEVVGVVNGELLASGVISCTGERAKAVIGDAKNGFPFQASIGADVESFEFVKAEQTVTVNGRDLVGPVNVVRQSSLREISFVDAGADPNTSINVAAKLAKEKESNMTEAEKKAAEATIAAKAAEDKRLADEETAKIKAAAELEKPGFVDLDNALAKATAKQEKDAEITRLITAAASQPNADIPMLNKLAAKAKAEDRDIRDLKLDLMQAMRPTVPNIGAAHTPSPTDQKVLEAALCIACGISDEVIAKDRDYGEDVAQAAYTHRNLGLHGIFAASLTASGVTAPHGGENLWRAALALHHSRQPIQAGFSTVSLPSLLGNVANKILLSSFLKVPSTYQRVAEQADFNNFHTHTIHRMTMDGDFEQVGPAGEIKHASLSEETSENKLETFGKMLTITRQDVINDDTSALTRVPAKLGRKAAIAVEKALYNGVVMEASDVFYTSGRGNKLTSNALSVTGLAAAEAAFGQMVDSDGDPIMAVPTILLVPSGLKYRADMLFTSATLSSESTTSGTAVEQPTDNPFIGRFRVETSPFMALSGITGSSADGWYLLADPDDIPAFQVAYLSGQRSPTVESTDAVFNTLGIQTRAYFDFGVAQVDYRGAVSSDA